MTRGPFFASPLFIVTSLVWITLGIVVAVDAGKYPVWAFTQTGSRKSTWQVWPIVLGFLCGIGALIMLVMWFASKKPAIERATGGGYGGGPGGYPPPPGGYPPPPGWTPPPPSPPGWPPPPSQ